MKVLQGLVKEEEYILRDCLRIVKDRLADPSSSSAVITRCLTFAAFAALLGHNVEYAYVHALNLAQNKSPVEKKIGYMACSFFLSEKNPLLVLITNTVLKDLASSNVLTMSIALCACCHLVTTENVSTFIPLVKERLSHSNGFVRRKAVTAMCHFYRVSPAMCAPYLKQMKGMLSDKDPAVVANVLQSLLSFVQNSEDVEDIVSPLIHIQEQVLQGNIPTDMMYKGLPAPWMQIFIMRLFSLLSSPSSEVKYLVRRTLDLAKGHAGKMIGAALTRECVLSLIKLDKEEDVPNLATSVVGCLLDERDTNLKYEGLSLMEDVVTHCPVSFTPEQRQVVLMGTSHPDHSYRRKTLELLCTTACPDNAESVCMLVIDYVKEHCADNSYLKTHFVKKAFHLADTYPSTSSYWHVAALLRLISVSGEEESRYIKSKIKASLMTDTSTVTKTREKVLKFLSRYLESKSASTDMLELYVWVLSRFHDGDSSVIVSEQLVDLGRKILSNSGSTIPLPKGISQLLLELIFALEKLCESRDVAADVVSEFVEEVLQKSVGSCHLQLCCVELQRMLQNLDDVRQTLSNTVWNEEEVDCTLTFLDSFVLKNLEAGGPIYRPKSLLPSATPELEVQPRPCSAMSEFPSSLDGSWKHLSADARSSVSVESSDSKEWYFSSPETSELSGPSLWSARGRVEETTTPDSLFSLREQLPQNLEKTVTLESEDPFDKLLQEQFPS